MIIMDQFHQRQNKWILPYSIGYIMHHLQEISSLTLIHLQNMGQNRRQAFKVRFRLMVNKVRVKVKEIALECKVTTLIPIIQTLEIMHQVRHSGSSPKLEKWLLKISNSLGQERKQVSLSNLEVHQSQKTNNRRAAIVRTDMALQIVTYSTIWTITKTVLMCYNSKIIGRKFRILRIRIKHMKTVKQGFLSGQYMMQVWIRATRERSWLTH